MFKTFCLAKSNAVVMNAGVPAKVECAPCPKCEIANVAKRKRTGPSPIGRLIGFLLRVGIFTGATMLTVHMGVWRAPMHPKKNMLETVTEDTQVMMKGIPDLMKANGAK